MCSVLKQSHISGKSRKIIYDVYVFFKKEADEANKSETYLIKRTAQATGINASTVKRIIKEITQLDHKKRNGYKTVTDMDNFDLGIIKRCIHNFHLTYKEIPTVEKLLEKLRVAINFKGSRTSLRGIINELGFKWKCIGRRRKIAVEKNDIRLQRINFLRSIKQYRKENRPIIYTDEAIIRILSTEDDTASDGTVTTKRKTYKIQSLIMLLAGTDKNFIPNTFLLFEHDRAVEEYKNTVSFEKYQEWLRNSLIPNLPPKSVVVFNNTHYHNVQSELSLSSYSSRELMQKWLTEREIPFTSDMHKPELYQLIKVNKYKFKKYILDNIITEHNHSVLRLPSHHPDLNPIKMIWKDVQTYVYKNAQSNKNRAYSIVREKLNLIEINEWKNLCDSIKAIEEEYSKSDEIVDQLTDEYLTQGWEYVDSGSSASDDSESEEENVDTINLCLKDIDEPSDSSTNKKRKINNSVPKDPASDSDDSD